MDPEDILKNNKMKFLDELDARPLLIPLKYIFPSSVAQEIERTIDRDGNIVAIDKILTHLPRRDNWVKTFYDVLRGRDINKPDLAKLFEPFVTKVAQQHSYSLPAQLRPTKDITEEEKQPEYTLDTCLKDIEYFQCLKELYPHQPANWKSFIKKHGLSLEATLQDLLEYIADEDITTYNEIKKVTKLRHTFVRQATCESIPDNQTSLTSTAEASDARYSPFSSKVSSTNSNVNSQVIADQEKALKKITAYQSEESMTKLVPTNFVPGSVYSLPTMPVIDLKKKNIEMDEVGEIIRKVPETNRVKCVVPEVGEIIRIAPETNRVKCVVPEVGEIIRKAPETNRVKCVVPEVGEIIKKAPEIDEVKSEISSVSEVKKEDRIKREVPQIAEGKKKVPQVAEGKKEVPQVAEGKKEVPQVAEGKKEVPQVAEGKKEVPQVAEGKKEVPQVAEGKKEVPQVNVAEKEVPEVNEAEKEVPEVDEAEKEFPEVDEAHEPVNGIEANLPIKEGNSLVNLSVLFIAVGLSFYFGYCYSKR